MSDEEIRRKTQVYEPDVLIILDDTLVHLPATYAGLKEGGTVVINSVHDAAALKMPAQAGKVAIVDATGICMEELGRNIPNTAMLGAFARVTGLVTRTGSLTTSPPSSAKTTAGPPCARTTRYRSCEEARYGKKTRYPARQRGDVHTGHGCLARCQARDGQDRCVNCGICLGYCPVGSIYAEGRRYS